MESSQNKINGMFSHKMFTADLGFLTSSSHMRSLAGKIRVPLIGKYEMETK